MLKMINSCNLLGNNISLEQIDSYPKSLQGLIRDLEQSADFLTPARAKDILLRTNISPQDLLPWADFNHPVTDSYGRKLLFQGKNFEIMVMSWLPGDFSAIHDHGSAQWGAVQCFGTADHYVYSFTEGILTTAKSSPYHFGMVHAVDRSLIHQMGNPGNKPFLSLHVYGCQEISDSITANARVFDLLEGSIQFTDGGVFFCLPESQINRCIKGLQADRETLRRHHNLMCDRIKLILKTEYDPNLEKKLIALESVLST